MSQNWESPCISARGTMLLKELRENPFSIGSVKRQKNTPLYYSFKKTISPDRLFIDAGEGEGLTWDLETLLVRLGDTRFSSALSHENGETQSAVAHYLETRILKNYPKTEKLLQSAPKIDFPSDTAARKSEEDYLKESKQEGAAS